MKNWGSKPYSGSGDYVGPKTQQSLAPNQFGVTPPTHCVVVCKTIHMCYVNWFGVKLCPKKKNFCLLCHCIAPYIPFIHVKSVVSFYLSLSSFLYFFNSCLFVNIAI